MQSSLLTCRLELDSSYWVPELPGADARQELAFLQTWGVCNEVAHYHVVLFDALLISDGFYIADCAAETLMIEIEYVVKLGWMVAIVEQCISK